MEFEPSNGINVIYGENGHGKTNIIESIWLFTGCNSFRTRKNTELINKKSLKNNKCFRGFYFYLSGLLKNGKDCDIIKYNR